MNCVNSLVRWTAAAVLFFTVPSGFSQNEPVPGDVFLPTVNISATDPEASEGRVDAGGVDGGTMVVRRSGGVDQTLVVFYGVGGTAVNGVDYLRLGGVVRFEPGVVEARIEVRPLEDGLREPAETVEVTLVPGPFLDPVPGSTLEVLGSYRIGPEATARVVIADNDGGMPPIGLAPRVEVVDPLNGQVFLPGEAVLIRAVVRDEDGFASLAHFFVDGIRIGEQEINFLVAPEPGTPVTFEFLWEAPRSGPHVVVVRARDDQGLWGSSAPVGIRVEEDPNLPVVVTLRVTDGLAQEPGLDPVVDHAVFTVLREGHPGVDVVVWYELGGTASNGEDYAMLSGSVMIPAGTESAEIVIEPLADEKLEGLETVELRIVPPACIAIFPPPPECYQIGARGSGVVWIRDGVRPPGNRPPEVEIVEPAAGAVFPEGVPIEIRAVVRDPDGYVSFAEFFANGVKIGEQRIDFLVPPEPGQPVTFELSWEGAQPGVQHLMVRVRDNGGAASAASVAIFVEGPSGGLPEVRLLNPPDGSMFVAPARIHLRASILTRAPQVFRVEFFAGENLLGIGLPLHTSLSPLTTFGLEWSDVPAGEYELTAVATGEDGVSSRSEPVRIRVVDREPPSGSPPVVMIRASDPIGSEGVDAGGRGTAAFSVLRSGDLSGPLTVHYEIEGTALNGVDYVEIGSEVVIPAGERSATILIEPLEDGEAEQPESVLIGLALPPGTGFAAGEPMVAPYLIGRQAKAAVLIVDQHQPRPPCMRLPDGLFHLCRPVGEEGCFRVEVSGDLEHWEVLSDVRAADGVLHFVDPEGRMFSRRFYRFVPIPCL